MYGVIGSDADTILFVFAESDTEVALSRTVDRLFVTSILRSAPFGRLRSTACFDRDINFVEETTARRTPDGLRAIPGAMEFRSGQVNPASA